MGDASFEYYATTSTRDLHMTRASFHTEAYVFFILVANKEGVQHVFTLLLWVEHIKLEQWQLQDVDLKQESRTTVSRGTGKVAAQGPWHGDQVGSGKECS
ncbi:hypothetical protein K492DRAFT_199841 [Lichtheimia hyalospora FSU 10163]|nr:hypothetical protein K492DRAFT_199841 [Lichtheimia hyalospora FSU 10163]